MPNVGPYIYRTLAFLALLGAPYIYDISSLRVKEHYNYVNTVEPGYNDIGLYDASVIASYIL